MSSNKTRKLDSPRQKIIDLMRDKFNDVSTDGGSIDDGSNDDDGIDIDRIIRRMERSCFEVAVRSCQNDGYERAWDIPVFVDRYSAECYKVITNIPALYKGLMSGVIDPRNVAYMSSYEMNPEASKKERNDIAIRKSVVGATKVSRSYRCKKCGGNETKLMEYSARGIDEAMTISVECVNCGHSWRR